MSGVVTISETGISSEKRALIRDRVRNALPLIAVLVALIVNAAWIGFLGYCITKLI